MVTMLNVLVTSSSEGNHICPTPSSNSEFRDSHCGSVSATCLGLPSELLVLWVKQPPFQILVEPGWILTRCYSVSGSNLRRSRESRKWRCIRYQRQHTLRVILDSMLHLLLPVSRVTGQVLVGLLQVSWLSSHSYRLTLGIFRSALTNSVEPLSDAEKSEGFCSWTH